MNKQEIIYLLENDIHSIISEVMEKENVTTGDVSPMQLMEYNRLIDKLADYIRIIVNQNKY